MRCVIMLLTALGLTACSASGTSGTSGMFAPMAQADVSAAGDGFLVAASGSSPQAVTRLAGKKANGVCLQQGKKVGQMRRAGANDASEGALEPRLEGEAYVLKAYFRCVEY